MKRLVIGVLAAALLSSCSSAGNDAVDQAAGGQRRFVAGDGSRTEFRPGDRGDAVTLTGELLDSAPFDVASLRGKVVVLNFWGSWCAPCRAEADDLEAVYQQHKPDGVEFVGVNVKDSRDSAEAFERSFAVTYPSLFDPGMRVALKLRKTPPNAIPATVVLDRAGRVAVVIRSPMLREELEPVVAKVLAEKS
jgi:thiol-disulfide isomerase/thioredoxin